jgi:hypothetical protein
VSVVFGLRTAGQLSELAARWAHDVPEGLWETLESEELLAPGP